MFVRQNWKRSFEERLRDRMSLICFVDAEDDDGAGGGDGQDDGGDDDGGGNDPLLTKIKTNNKKLTSELKKTRDRMRELEAMEEERNQEKAAREEEDARKAKDFEKLEKGYETKLKDAEMKYFDFQSKYENLVIDLDLTKALDGAEIDKTYRDAVIALLRAKHKFKVNEDGEAEIDEQPLGDFISGWAKTDDGKKFIINGNSGGGSPGSGKGSGANGKNPWKPGEGTISEQMALYRENPEQARALAKVHGVILD